MQYKKGKKTIVTLFPERESFTVLLTFGKPELEKITGKRASFSKTIIDMIENTKQYHDGKWVWIRCKDEIHLSDIKELIKIKRKPERSYLA